MGWVRLLLQRQRSEEEEEEEEEKTQLRAPVEILVSPRKVLCQMSISLTFANFVQATMAESGGHASRAPGVCVPVRREQSKEVVAGVGAFKYDF